MTAAGCAGWRPNSAVDSPGSWHARMPDPSPTSPQDAARRAPRPGPDTGVTPRAVGIGLIVIAALAVAGFAIEMVLDLAYDFNTQSPPVAPLGAAVIVAMGSMLIARQRGGLTRRELLVIYSMVTVGAPVVAHGTLVWMLSITIGQREYARSLTEWPAVFFEYIPAWFAPAEPSSIEGFFQGQATVPWSLWLFPAAAWGLFFLALYLGNLCLLVIFRRQWAANERLSFPVAQVPLEAFQERATGEVWLSPGRALRLGFGLVFVAGLLFRLSTIYPSIPALPLNDWVLIPWQPTGPLAGFGDFTISFWPTGIGLAYLIPKELSFSVWFFWYLRVAETVAAIAAGVTPMRPQDYWGTEFPAPYYQGGGAVIALGILAFWSGRHYLRQALRQALRGEGEDDVPAPLSYRLALAGLALCAGYMVVFCMAAGSRLIVAALLVGLILAYHVVWARLRAENGMSFIGFPYTVGSVMQEPFGTALLRPREVVTINALSWTYWPGWGEGCEVITGASLDALKISSAARIPQRPLLLAMSVGFVLALVFGTWVVLTGIYQRGFWNFQILYSSWIPITMRNLGQGNYDGIANPSGFSLAMTAPLMGGMAFTFLLAAMRARFWWWPLHPVGYLAANVWGTQSWWCPMFVGWLVKSLVIRYGGLRLYQQTMPAAVGMILADRLLSFVWPLVVALAR